MKRRVPFLALVVILVVGLAGPVPAATPAAAPAAAAQSPGGQKEDAARQVQVSVADATICLDADAKSAVVAKPGVGTILEVVAASGDWLQVRAGKDAQGFERIGFIRAVQVKRIEAVPAGLPVVPRSARPTVAVLDFDYATVKQEWAGLYIGPKNSGMALMDVVDVGKGLADLLVDELLQTGQVRILDRRHIDAVLREQDLARGDRADPSAGEVAQLKKILGARYFVTGSVTKFGNEEKQVKAGALGWGPFRGLLGGAGKKDSIARVGLSSRIIDSSTGEILASVKAEKDSRRRGLLLGGLGGGSAVAGGGFEIGSSNFQETILGEAMMLAVREAAARLTSAIQQLTTEER